jgi:tetratricopeptide (TPR) repeat protein
MSGTLSGMPRRTSRRAGRASCCAAGLALILAWTAGAPLHAAAVGDLFEAGNTAYEESRFQEAAATYERILAYGMHDPRVYYNLGNAYFKLGRLGAAILNYERALKIAPWDREARDNLELAQGQIRDRVVAPQMQYPIRVIKRTLDALSVNGLSWVFLVLYLGAGTLSGCALLARAYARRRLFGYGALAAGLCAAIVCGSLLYRIQGVTARSAIVMQDRVDVRSGPAEDNTVLFTVHEGLRLDLRNRLEGWYQVSLPNNLSGWIPAASVEQV